MNRHTSRIFVFVTILGFCLSQTATAAINSGYTSGYWNCQKSGWGAYTTYRSMEGATAFECGGGCGDNSHNQPYSWVDFTGGISQSQQDHSDSFFGPVGGEWNGCAFSGTSQVSNGYKPIDGVNQAWDRWPLGWYTSTYSDADISFWNDSSAPMRNPYGSVYDLDCAPGWISWTWGGSCPKEVIGTVFWDDFAVTARLVAGDPVADVAGGYGYARWELAGDTGVFCSTPANGCESVVCSDMHVRSSFQCVWVPIDNCMDTGTCPDQ
jgi:hypothetical protein